MKNKRQKRSHAYKDYASTYNVENLKSYNGELQRKGIESALRNKEIYFLTELEEFKF